MTNSQIKRIAALKADSNQAPIIQAVLMVNGNVQLVLGDDRFQYTLEITKRGRIID